MGLCPRGARRISILHDKLGILRNYFYPDIIEKATVYEMVLNTSDDQNKPVAESNMQFLVVRPEPATANVYINEEPVPVENGLFNATMPKGEHTYRVEAPMYQPDAGVIKLGNTPVTKSVALKPKFRLPGNLLTARAGCRRIHRQRTGRKNSLPQ